MSTDKCGIVKTAKYSVAILLQQGGALVEYDELVEYYRRKLMERYVAYTNRDLVQRIIYLLSSADPDTLAVILGLLQSKN